MNTKKFKHMIFKIIRSTPVIFYAYSVFFKNIETKLANLGKNIYASVALILVSLSMFIMTLLAFTGALFFFLVQNQWSCLAASGLIALFYSMCLFFTLYLLNKRIYG